MVQKSEDMNVRQRRVVSAFAPVAQSRPIGLFEPAHDLPSSEADGAPQARVVCDASDQKPTRRWRASTGMLWFLGFAATVFSAIGAKELGPVRPLAALDAPRVARVQAEPQIQPVSRAPLRDATDAVAALEAALTNPGRADASADLDTRWFNGRPVRPARTIRMRVTAYSPHAASCYPFADGQTATLHGVDTNGGFLVAADTDVLPFGSMLSIQGYAEDSIVPVLDRGGAIKGNRLDVLFPTHEAALRWGVRDIDVVVWEYADGKPADDPRKLRS